VTDFAKKYKWWEDAARLRVGLLKRPQPQVPHMTRPKWIPEIDELTAFADWLLWFDGGKKGKRPPFHRRVPAWAWKVWGEYHTTHPKPPTKPGPDPQPANNPPSIWKGAPWTKKHVHISHGLRNVDGTWTVPQLVERCLQSGAKAVFAQLGSDNPDPDWAEHARELYAAGRERGLQVGGWGRADYADWDIVRANLESVLPLDGFLADVEQRCNDQQLPEHLAGAFPDLPMGVIATGGIDQSFDNHTVQECAARWGDRFDFVGQDYYKADLPLTPDSGENFVYWRSTAKLNGKGFRHLPDANGRWHVPVVMPNAETCPPLAAHAEWLKPYSPHFGVWDGELLEAHDEWGVFASI